jgi:mxaJ protein
MYSLCLRLALLCVVSAPIAANAAPLRICADPDNLPFSNRAEQGFDNRIAIVIAHKLGREPEFIWTRSRRGFMREEFNKGACDVLMGVPEGMRTVASSRPYYRSSYVFVTRKKDRLHIARFDDPHLNGRRIGLQILEEDYAPPSLPLIRNGHAAQLVGFDTFGVRSADIVHAVADARIGVAVVWGPLAGYVAARDHLPVALTAVSPRVDSSGVPFTYEITIGVHKKDTALHSAINHAIDESRVPIRAILARYHVPVTADEKEAR